MNSHATKDLVREAYSAIARSGGSCCCSSSTAPRTAASTYAGAGDVYAAQEGYVAEADLGLGCGVPTTAAGLAEGQVVLDLGSGAGNDVFLAARAVGPAGRVIGVDFSAAMIARAEATRARLGLAHVEFRAGEIEALPVADATVDVVLSNCVLNLVPDKRRAFAEIHRVLRPGGHFAVSDIVVTGPLPEGVRRAAELVVGCIAGALPLDAYLGAVRAAGFGEPEIVRRNEVPLPDEDLRPILGPEELAAFRASGTKVLSVTVRAARPVATPSSCCSSTCCSDR